MGLTLSHTTYGLAALTASPGVNVNYDYILNIIDQCLTTISVVIHISKVNEKSRSGWCENVPRMFPLLSQKTVSEKSPIQCFLKVFPLNFNEKMLPH